MGPESFLDEMIQIDSDFFGRCCEDCERQDDGLEVDEEADLAPVLAVLR